MKPTLHVVGLPWTETTSRYSICAYTQKLTKFGGMMRDQGYRVVLYAGEENQADVDEHVPVVTRAERDGWFGEWNPDDAFSYVTWEPLSMPWHTMNHRAVEEIKKRREEHDLLLLVAGLSQKPIAESMPGMLVCEPFVGYEGIWTDFCAYESSAWMHYLYAKYNPSGHDNGRWYDAVIPNYFDPDAFHVETKDDYLLFIGRILMRKGPHVAAQIANALGRRLIVAGPGAKNVTKRPDGGDRIETVEGIVVEGPKVEYVGSVDPVERAELMAKATALIAPTFYLEPFGGVAVEGMLSGTPAITSDWGAFRETVTEGVSGCRFRTLLEGVAAVAEAETLNPEKIREYALARYSLDAVGPQFDTWFDRLGGLWGEGWTALPEALRETA